MPSAPAILGIEDEAIEEDPQNQHVRLQLDLPQDAEILSVQIRIIHFTYDDARHKWKQHHRIFETHTPEASVTVTRLTAGRYYSFQAAVVNEVDE
ncbi:unnamed protein product, partial [Symbiodinium pilosum]